MADPSVFDRFRLDGRTVLMSGAGPGIGTHVSKEFAAVGANVVVSARTAERVEALAAEIREAGGRAIAIAADAGNLEDTERLAERAQAEFGPVHVLFCSVAFGALPIDSDPFAADVAHWQQAFTVNVLTPYRLAQLLVPGMRAAGYGSIINLLTCAAFTPILPQMAYGATKSALQMLTRYLAKAGGGVVRANCICPGSMSPDGNVKPMFAKHRETNAIKRTGLAEEVVGAALLLASPASSYTTGQTIFCEGGRVGTIS